MTQDDELKQWQALGDLAADFALMIQTSATAPRRIVKAALDLIEMHRDLRPEMYGPRIERAHRKGPTQ